MKVAIPVEGEFVNQHFGKSRDFAIASIMDGVVSDIHLVNANNLQHNHEGLSDLLLREGVGTVIVGGIGAPAKQALEINGLSVIRGAQGFYREVLEQFSAGKLSDQNVTCNHHGDHHH
ncbi:NifB/NifX family molybdenum-iron cluster-binding protein [Syntrophomonas erecta]